MNILIAYLLCINAQKLPLQGAGAVLQWIFFKGVKHCGEISFAGIGK